MNWELKIASFLNRPPDFSLFPENAWARGENWIKLLLGEKDSSFFSKVQEIEAVACGLDIPPFVEDIKIDSDFFRQKPILVHPLSAQEYPLKIPENLEEGAVQSRIENIFSIIKAQSGGDRKKLFFLLWRLLPDLLAKDDPNKLGNIWKVLPADPRIPSHSIWDHAAAASAIAGAGDEPALLLFTIASAQEMVATARRTQDAWMGSFLLSYLSWQAIKVVAEECGPDAIIFPSLRGQPMVDFWLSNEMKIETIQKPADPLLEIANIPNLFTAIIPKAKAEDLAHKAEVAVIETWEEIAGIIKDRIEKTVCKKWKGDTSSWKEIWAIQTKEFIKGLGIYFVICPWGSDPQQVIHQTQKNPSDWAHDLEDFINKIPTQYSPNIGMVYALLSGFAGRGLTSRKNLRNFNQVNEPGHKCSLCGKWKAVHPDFIQIKSIEHVTKQITNPTIKTNPEEKRYHYRWLKAFWEALAEVTANEDERKKEGLLKLKGRIRNGERLCSACLTRRLAFEGYFLEKFGFNDWHLFPSTAGIATADYRQKILQTVKENPGSKLTTAFSDFTENVGKFVRENDFPYPAASSTRLKEQAQKVEKGIDFLKIDGDWLFEGSYEYKDLERITRLDNTQDKVKTLKIKVKQLINEAKENKLGTPTGYYAILALDADSMGDWLISKKAPLMAWMFHPEIRENQLIQNTVANGMRRPLGPALQLAMSNCLKHFSLHWARDIVEGNNPGKLIYAGGDDLVAFLPLASILPVMQEIYLTFRGGPDGWLTTGKKEKDGQIPGELLPLMGGIRQGNSGEINHQGMSASIAVVIAHHTFPLYQAMQEAQKVLKHTAKEGLKRDSFALRILRRSGEFTETGYRFNVSDKVLSCSVIESLEKILVHLTENKEKERALSGKLPYEMAKHPWASYSSDDSENSILDNARGNELVRIAKRHSKKGKEEEISNDINSLYYEISNRIMNGPPSVNVWKTLSDLLLILVFLSGKGK